MAQNKESCKDNLLSLLYFGYITFALFGTNAKERHQDQVLRTFLMYAMKNEDKTN